MPIKKTKKTKKTKKPKTKKTKKTKGASAPKKKPSTNKKLLKKLGLLKYIDKSMRKFH